MCHIGLGIEKIKCKEELLQCSSNHVPREVHKSCGRFFEAPISSYVMVDERGNGESHPPWRFQKSQELFEQIFGQDETSGPCSSVGRL